MLNKRLLAVLTGACLMATPAAAQQIDSDYTKIDLNKCTVLSIDDQGGEWACSGYKDYPVYVAEGDLRMFVSYGDNAANEKAAWQTFPQFNEINETLEWRLKKNGGKWVPFATILRFFTQSAESPKPDGQVLVVTKLEPGNTCHIAYIDARRVKNANAVARQFADETAASFDCASNEPARVPD